MQEDMWWNEAKSMNMEIVAVLDGCVTRQLKDKVTQGWKFSHYPLTVMLMES